MSYSTLTTPNGTCAAATGPPPAGMVLTVRRAFRTLAGYDYLPGDQLVLLNKTYTGQYGWLHSQGNWIVRDRHWTSEWSCLPDSIADGILTIED